VLERRTRGFAAVCARDDAEQFIITDPGEPAIITGGLFDVAHDNRAAGRNVEGLTSSETAASTIADPWEHAGGTLLAWATPRHASRPQHARHTQGRDVLRRRSLIGSDAAGLSDNVLRLGGIDELVLPVRRLLIGAGRAPRDPVFLSHPIRARDGIIVPGKGTGGRFRRHPPTPFGKRVLLSVRIAK
jgi:hypothetical protein